MQGDSQVIDYLNKALTNELTAINQYWLHYRQLKNGGMEQRDLLRVEPFPECRQAFGGEVEDTQGGAIELGAEPVHFRRREAAVGQQGLPVGRRYGVVPDGEPHAVHDRPVALRDSLGSAGRPRSVEDRR